MIDNKNCYITFIIVVVLEKTSDVDFKGFLMMAQRQGSNSPVGVFTSIPAE